MCLYNYAVIQLYDYTIIIRINNIILSSSKASIFITKLMFIYL